MLFLSRKKLKEAGDALRNRELTEIFPQEAERFLQDKKEKAAEQSIGALSRRRLIRRGVAVTAVLVMLIISGVTLGPKAYAKIQAWIKGQSGGYNTVKPVSVHPEAAFPTYRLGWRPERFERCFPLENQENTFSEEYRNDHLVDVSMDAWEETVKGRYDRTDLFPAPGKLWAESAPQDSSFFGWGYYKISEYEDSVMSLHRIDIRTEEERVTEEGQWEIGDWEVLYYLYYAYGSESFADGQSKTYRYDMICCIWVDQEHDVAFRMDGTLTKEEAQKMIENVKLVK